MENGRVDLCALVASDMCVVFLCILKQEARSKAISSLEEQQRFASQTKTHNNTTLNNHIDWFPQHGLVHALPLQSD
jgi:hypothetical protein